MAQVDFVLAVVAVSDITAGRAWYTTLFGREPDNNPMPNLIEWQVNDGGWVQVTEDRIRAGHGLLNLAVSDLDDGVRELQQRGLGAGESSTPTRASDCSRSTTPTTTSSSWSATSA
jgi:glyoxylase I family protein